MQEDYFISKLTSMGRRMLSFSAARRRVSNGACTFMKYVFLSGDSCIGEKLLMKAVIHFSNH